MKAINFLDLILISTPFAFALHIIEARGRRKVAQTPLAKQDSSGTAHQTWGAPFGASL